MKELLFVILCLLANSIEVFDGGGDNVINPEYALQLSNYHTNVSNNDTFIDYGISHSMTGMIISVLIAGILLATSIIVIIVTRLKRIWCFELNEDTNDAFREEDGAEAASITECDEEIKNRLMFIEEMELFGKNEQSVKEYSLELRNVNHDLTLIKDNQFKGLKGNNKAILIFNDYDNKEAKGDGWPQLLGVANDKVVMRHMLRNDYDILEIVNERNFFQFIDEKTTRWRGEKMRRLHFHFSGHGILNTDIDAFQTKELVMKGKAPIGHCLVGNEGEKDIVSVWKVKYFLTQFDAEKITLSLDCCRSFLQSQRGKKIELSSEKVEPRSFTDIPTKDWERMFTIYSTCTSNPSFDDNSLSQELWRVYQNKNERIAIKDMAEIVNTSWHKRNIHNQRCTAEMVKVDGNWNDEFWPL